MVTDDGVSVATASRNTLVELCCRGLAAVVLVAGRPCRTGRDNDRDKTNRREPTVEHNAPNSSYLFLLWFTWGQIKKLRGE